MLNILLGSTFTVILSSWTLPTNHEWLTGGHSYAWRPTRKLHTKEQSVFVCRHVSEGDRARIFVSPVSSGRSFYQNDQNNTCVWKSSQLYGDEPNLASLGSTLKRNLLLSNLENVSVTDSWLASHVILILIFPDKTAVFCFFKHLSRTHYIAAITLMASSLGATQTY